MRATGKSAVVENHLCSQVYSILGVISLYQEYQDGIHDPNTSTGGIQIFEMGHVSVFCNIFLESLLCESPVASVLTVAFLKKQPQTMNTLQKLFHLKTFLIGISKYFVPYRITIISVQLSAIKCLNSEAKIILVQMCANKCN